MLIANRAGIIKYVAALESGKQLYCQKFLFAYMPEKHQK